MEAIFSLLFVLIKYSPERSVKLQERLRQVCKWLVRKEKTSGDLPKGFKRFMIR